MAELTKWLAVRSRLGVRAEPRKKKAGIIAPPFPPAVESWKLRLISSRRMDSQSTHATLSPLILVPKDPDIAR
jgi:hypothetical protein